MMADRRILTLIAYDIESIRARAKVSKLLERVAVRVQKSVFEARLGRSESDKLARLLTPHVSSGDSVRFYPVETAAQDRLMVIGAGRPPENGPFLLF